MTMKNTSTDTSCYPKTLQSVYQRPIWCRRPSGGTLGSSRAKDGCITWSTSQSRTSCCSGALWLAKSHKGENLWVLWKISPVCHRSSHQNKIMLSRLPSSFVVGDLRFGLMPLDLEKDYHIYEQWLLNGERIEGIQLGKRLLHVLTAGLQKPSNQLTWSFWLYLICPTCWTRLDIPAF